MTSPAQILIQMRSELRIVLLGPGEAQVAQHRKRIDIRDRLLAEGYDRAVLGEQVIGPETVLPLSIELESNLESDDLILVLNAGPAPLVELTTIWQNQTLRENTEVWCPREYWTVRRSTPGDVLEMFDYRLYGDAEFQTCDLTEQFVHSAHRTCFARAQRAGYLTSLGFLPP